MKELIDTGNLPKHIAVIMDGNGRWAQNQGAARIFGHRNAIKAVREVTEGCAELGVGFLTLYAFSTENWARPEFEVRALMELLVQSISNELPTMLKNNVKLDTIGDTESLPRSCRNTLADAVAATKDNTGLNLILALGYSGKWDITQAARKIAEDVKKGIITTEEINEEMLAAKLATQNRPEVDLMLRTGGDHRISNFLLWQLAYAELYFYENLFWPDFRREHLYEAIAAFQNRERRFGKTGEQIKANSAK
ncbi:isoprenyl transferase [Dyadobacter fanqingshengii]|uniref:Isoprenyl transferase n=1 Tax=Dyadobacter fanqingshengii TaxID=2906443 RepID=A0A9X1P926_9BACT|nr:isoprenyl transferase [Dyadobacter fanqingshengii]MCF0038895.1 isoprenyl transferase [Dyadobacter fanqingshengii]MCF2503562.1 isoprenyl transferase [Dyadobacter fanqingshengii]USJ34281.1 isoprenyl transferase [Dyadobacter fanqingshengii]